MTININSPFRSTPRISRYGFISVLQRQGSFESDALWLPTPRYGRIDVAGEVYDAIIDEGGDPAAYLAICGREHTFGTNTNSVLHRGQTRSWGNQRTIRHPGVDGEIYHDGPRGSSYVRFRDVRDSARDAVYRVNESGFAYDGKTSILEVVSTWAPSSDDNAPRAFAQYIADRINEWAAEFPVKQDSDMNTINGVPLRVDYIPRGNSNRPGYGMNPTWITVHETGNQSNGANAEMHRRFVNGGGGSANVSWHYTVDDREIVQHLPLNENGWHAGDGGNGTGNRESIGIETCINADGNWGKTLDNLARLIAWLQKERGIPETRVVQHNHWSGKNCPARMRASGGKGWRDLLTMVAGYRDSPTPTPSDPCQYFTATGHYLCYGFRGFWNDNGGLAIFGYPLSAEFQDEDGATIQWFERARFEHRPDIASNPHGVVLGRVGAESLARDRERVPEAFERQEPPK